MTRTEYQNTTRTTQPTERHEWTGVANYATHTPAFTPPTTGGYPYQPTKASAKPTHNRVAIIGATGVALLLAAMGGIALMRMQDAAAPATVATVTVPQSVYDSQVPTAALRTVSVPQSVFDSQVPAAAGAAAVVPHGAAAEMADAMAAATRVSVPQSVYDSQVPTAALRTVSVPQSVYDSQVPQAALATVTVPQSVIDSQVPAAALRAVSVPQSVYDSQVPQEATAVVGLPHGAAPVE
jgi:hypothetical protein